jgi:hypothetical protein
MSPYPESQSKGNSEKSIFNYRLYRAKGVVENAFGIVSQKFQIYQRGVMQMFEAVLQKYKTKEEVPTKVLLK